MQLQQDSHNGQFQIKSFHPGKLKVNDETYRHSIIISLNHLSKWAVQHFEDLAANDWQSIIELKPEIVIVGTGEKIHFPAPEILAPLHEKQIGVEFMSTAAACRTFQLLAAENRHVVAALIV